MAAPGDLLSPADLAVGSLVQARDPSDIWYNAEVLEKLIVDGEDAVTIRYTGFGPASDETFVAADERIRKRIPFAALRREDEWIREYKRSMARALLANCLLYTSPSPRDKRQSRMPSSA